MVLCGKRQTFTMKKETILTPTTTQIMFNKVPTVPRVLLGSNEENERFHNIAHDRHNAKNTPLSSVVLEDHTVLRQ